MMYSSAGYESEGASLEAASPAKLESLCRKLALSPDEHLLEVGTGLAGLAVYGASRFGCRVTTITISRAPFDAARARVRDAGLSSWVDVLLSNYRDVEGQFDSARTLRAWRCRFEARLVEIAALGFDDTFVRMWRFYLAYCETRFLERAISDAQMVFAGSRYRRQPWRALLNPPIIEEAPQ